MPNFDALRSAIIGPLAYICRQKLAPAELLCCCPMSPNDKSDKSRYNNTLSIGSASWSDNYGLSACTGNSLLCTLNKPLDLSSPWAFEMGVVATSNLQDVRTYRLQFGNYAICIARNNSVNAMAIIYLNGTQTIWPGFPIGSFNHIGIVHNAGKVGLYYNGVRQHEATITLSGNQTSISYGSLTNLYINNLRLIQKNVAEGQSFPYDVPATYYTGFEPI